MHTALTRFVFCSVLFVLAATAHAQSGSLEGVIIGHKGAIVTIAPTSFTGADPANGNIGDMSKYFEEKLGKMNMSGWLGIARVEFVPTTTQYTDIKILEEKSEILVNGEKVDHFKVGNRIKIEWPAEVKEPETETK